MAKPDFIAEVGIYEGTPGSLEAVIRKLHPDVNVSRFSAGTRYLVRERQSFGYVMINVALFHKNGSHSSYNVQISVSSPEMDCKQYVNDIVQEAGVILLPKLDRRSIILAGVDGTGYAGTPGSTQLSPRVVQQIMEIV